MNLTQLGTVDSNSPDAVDFVPGPLVAKHQQGGIGRRELNVVEPVRARVKRPNLSAADVDREEPHRPASQPSSLEARFLILRNQVRLGWGISLGPDGFALNIAARKQSLVSVHRKARCRPELGSPGNRARRLRVEVSSVDSIINHVKHLTGLPSDDDFTRATLDNLFDPARLKVDRR
jgi:hypothetical protein